MYILEKLGWKFAIKKKNHTQFHNNLFQLSLKNWKYLDFQDSYSQSIILVFAVHMLTSKNKKWNVAKLKLERNILKNRRSEP